MAMRCSLLALVVAPMLAGAVGVRSAAGQAPPAKAPPALAALPGMIAERVTVPGDSSRAFAVYEPSRTVRGAVPPAGGAARTPVLLVLDPRGRAMEALRLFAPAAEALGWTVISSYNSASDGAEDPNIVAVRDMIEWAQRSLKPDMRRVYIAGMSGTARAAWLAMADYRPYVAGLFLAAGTTPAPGTELAVAGDRVFSIVATTGTGDFNYEEVRRLGETLDSLRAPARVDWFEGPHGWPTAEIVRRALYWFDVRAMRAGLAPLDSARVRAWLAGEQTRVDSLDHAGQWDLAERLAVSGARDAQGWAEGSALAARAADLAARPALLALRGRLRRERDRERAQALEIERVLAWERAQADAPDADDILKRMGVPALQQALASADSVVSGSASRRLARVQVMLAVYAPAAWERMARPERAARLREAARRVNPRHATP